jgi:hypothetical protein
LGSPFGEPNIRLRRQPKLVWKSSIFADIWAYRANVLKLLGYDMSNQKSVIEELKKTFHIPPQANKAITFF